MIIILISKLICCLKGTVSVKENASIMLVKKLCKGIVGLKDQVTHSTDYLIRISTTRNPFVINLVLSNILLIIAKR